MGEYIKWSQEEYTSISTSKYVQTHSSPTLAEAVREKRDRIITVRVVGSNTSDVLYSLKPLVHYGATVEVREEDDG